MTIGTTWSLLLRATPKVAATTGAACGLATLNSYCSATSNVSCERQSYLRRKFSTTGRLPFAAEGDKNPTSPTILVALVGKPFDKEDFKRLWKTREMESRHPRFEHTIDLSTPKEKEQSGSDLTIRKELPLNAHVMEEPFPKVYNLDLQERLKSLLQMPMDLQRGLWQVEVLPGGSLGQSGAVSKEVATQRTMEYSKKASTAPTESLVLFRGHEALADGVSLTEALIDLCDEAAEIRDETAVQSVEEKQAKALSWWERLAKLLRSLYFSSLESLKAFLYFWKLRLATSQNPFQQIEELGSKTTPHGKRSVGWTSLTTVAEVEEVAESLTKEEQVTINDVIISCVNAAVARQIQEHQMDYEMDREKPRNIRVPKYINVMVPVKAESDKKNGDMSLGHQFGAFFAALPGDITSTAAQRLERVHESLHRVQQAPVCFWSRTGALLLSTFLPASWATSLVRKTQPNPAFMVATCEGPSRRIHFAGREVETLQEFTSLPSGVPIGVVVSTYAGNLSLSVTAEPWAVPDADKFLSWVLNEYKFLYTESPVAIQTS